jgi:hypothetical protein
MPDFKGGFGRNLRVLDMAEVLDAYASILVRFLKEAIADDYRLLERHGEAYWLGVAEGAPEASALIAMRIMSNMKRGFDTARADKTRVPGLVWSYLQRPCYQELMERYPDWEDCVELPDGLTQEKLGKLVRPIVKARFNAQGVKFVR